MRLIHSSASEASAISTSSSATLLNLTPRRASRTPELLFAREKLREVCRHCGFVMSHKYAAIDRRDFQYTEIFYAFESSSSRGAEVNVWLQPYCSCDNLLVQIGVRLEAYLH